MTDLDNVTPAPGNGSTPVNGIEIVLTFQSNYNFGIARSYNGTLRTVISSVPSY